MVFLDLMGGLLLKIMDFLLGLLQFVAKITVLHARRRIQLLELLYLFPLDRQLCHGVGVIFFELLDSPVPLLKLLNLAMRQYSGVANIPKRHVLDCAHSQGSSLPPTVC